MISLPKTKGYKFKYKGTEMGQCHRCRKIAPVTHHHLIYGNPRRIYSDHFDLVRKLCMDCHDELHKRNPQLAENYKRIAEEDFLERWGSREEFIKIFGRSYT